VLKQFVTSLATFEHHCCSSSVVHSAVEEAGPSEDIKNMHEHLNTGFLPGRTGTTL
jgi:hypothetical protein